MDAATVSVEPGWPATPSAITAARRREEFGAALERRGARVIYAPAIRIVPLADDTELLEATERCLRGPLDFVVATTGIGFRGWIEAADAWGPGEELVKAIGQATDARARAEGTRRGARRRAARGVVAGVRVVQRGARAPDRQLRPRRQADRGPVARRAAAGPGETLRMAGADVIEVPVYRWVPPRGRPQPLRRLDRGGERLHGRRGRFHQRARGRQLPAGRATSCAAATSYGRRCAGRSCAACVGPVTAGPLLREGIPVIQPVRGRLGALVREIVEQLPLAPGDHRPRRGPPHSRSAATR